MLHSPVGRERAFVLMKQTDVDCSTDPFVTKCNAAFGGNGVATCLGIDDAKFTLTNGVLEIELPEQDSKATPYRATAGPAVVAVAKADQNGETICAALKDRDDPCGKAITSESGLHACVHKFVEPPTSDDACGTNAVTDFPGPTLLPAANESYTACAKEKPGQDFCADSNATASELRYAADGDGSVLVPMNWAKSRDACACGKFRVAGEFIPPSNLTFDIPENKPNHPSRNFWLQSYTFQGHQNDPEFALSAPPKEWIRAFWGTDEEDLSVLRFERRLTKCVGSENFCADGSSNTCANSACQKHCKSDHAKSCTANTGCSGQACGKVFDFTQEMKQGRWRLTRETVDRSFCEEDFGKCSADAPCASSDCVTYLLSLGECDCTDTKVPPPPVPPGAITPLANAFDVDGDDLIASAASADGTWIAAIMPTSVARKQKALPDRCRNSKAPSVVAVARSGECGAAAPCRVDCPDLGAGALRPRLSVVGSQVRVLQDRPTAELASRNWFSRVFAWFRSLFAHDAGVAPVEDTALATLRLIDARDVGRVSTIPNVVAPHDLYDPLTVSQRGEVTRFRVRAGRCVAEGRVLGIPSVCRPERLGECPSWATCQPDDVAVVADLAIDVDDDGVPDRLDDVVRVGSATPRTRP